MDVFCFDFDGVICDSAPETAVTAWQGCRTLWPRPGAELPEALQERFCRLRPVLHTGYEAIPLMRLIEDDRHSDAQMLETFPALRDALMAQEGLSVARLEKLFGGVRDRLIEEDQAQWLRWNRFYSGARELLAAAMDHGPVWVITTKQTRFVELLFRHHDVALPRERIFGLEQKRSKPQILAGLLGQPELQGARFHFLEDRLETLQSVIATPALQQVRLYLADWGYNTPRQRQEASSAPRITVVSLATFRQLLGL